MKEAEAQARNEHRPAHAPSVADVFQDVAPKQYLFGRALDQKAEEGLLLRREGHHQRGVITLNEPAFAVCGAGQEGDLDLQRRMTEILELTVPDEPFFVLAARPLRQRDAAAGTRAVYRCALKDRASDGSAADMQAFDVPEEQQGSGFDLDRKSVV